MENAMIRNMVRGAYDLQKLRISMGNRITANFKAKLGALGIKEENLDKVKKIVLKHLRSEYKRITTAAIEVGIDGDGIIDNRTKLDLVRQYLALEDMEARCFADLERALKGVDVWDGFLKDVKGVGPAMGGVIISEIDIAKAQYPSSLWAYAGLDVADDGRGRSRRKDHLVKKSYVDKNGNPAERVGITFNPFLKTKLLGVLAASFLRAGRNGNPYAEAYYDYKRRLEHHEAHKEKTPSWRNNMAKRYMVKRFLVDLYTAWRSLAGLPVAPEYSEAKLGKVHRAA